MSYTRGVSRTHWVSCTRTDRVSCTRTHRASCTRTAFHARTGRRACPHATARHTHAPSHARTVRHVSRTRTLHAARHVHDLLTTHAHAHTHARSHAIALHITPGPDVTRDVTPSPRYLWKKTSLTFLLLKKDTRNTPETCNAAKNV